MKISECIATIDGVRPRLDEMTKLIWSVQRHLLSDGNLEHFKSPYDEYDKNDKLIVKTILEITARDSQIGYNELEYQVKEALFSLRELPSFSSTEAMVGNVSALLAEKLYPATRFHDLFFAEQKNAILNFIRRHSALCKTGVGAMPLTELVRRIIALYTLASGLPKTVSDAQIISAVNASYPVPCVERPDLPQSLYAFLSAEQVLMRNEEYCHSPAFVTSAILSAYKEAILLPEFKPEEMEMLEIVIWKTLSEMEGLLEKLPYKNGVRIEEEIANILIENPQKNFFSLVQATVQFFKRAKELVENKKSQDIERKIHTWAIQGDMLYRWIGVDQDSPLMKLICQEWHKQPRPLAHSLFVGHICQLYLKEHPELTAYARQLSSRTWILYKHAWYSLFSSKKESSYVRFLKWHILSTCHHSKQHCLHKLREIVSTTLPLIPFDTQQCEEILEEALSP